MGTSLRRFRHRVLLWVRPLLAGIWITKPMDLWYIAPVVAGSKLTQLAELRRHLLLPHPEVTGAPGMYCCEHQPLVELSFRHSGILGLKLVNVESVSSQHFDESFYELQSPSARDHGEELLSHFAKYGFFQLLRPLSNVFHVRPDADWAMRDAPLESKRRYIHSENDHRALLQESDRAVLSIAMHQILENDLEPAPPAGSESDQSVVSAPVFSIVIPCYNQAQFLGDALTSVAAATTQSHECIVVDDGNAALDQIEALKSLSSVASHQSVVIIHQENGGLAKARNAGLSRATGTHIKFLDSDDALTPGSLDSQLENMVAHVASADIGGYAVVDSALTTLVSQPGPLTSVPLEVTQALTRHDLLKKWEQGLSIPIHAALIMREKCPMFTPSLRSKEDFSWWMMLAESKIKVSLSPGVAALYRQHDAQMTSSSPAVHGLYFLEALYISDQRAGLEPSLVSKKVAYIESFYGSAPIDVWAESDQERASWLSAIR